MTVVEKKSETTDQPNSSNSKACPWAEQEWTPDAGKCFVTFYV